LFIKQLKQRNKIIAENYTRISRIGNFNKAFYALIFDISKMIVKPMEDALSGHVSDGSKL